MESDQMNVHEEADLAGLLAALDDGQKRTVEDLVNLCLSGEVTVGIAKGYTAKDIEAMYHLAFDLYRQRRYEDAQNVFEMLVFYEGPETRFWLGLGGCHQMQGNYEQAVMAYSLLAVIDSTNPLGAFHASECFIAMKEWDKARQSLDAAEGVCELAAQQGDETDHSATLAAIKRLSGVVDSKLSEAGA